MNTKCSFVDCVVHRTTRSPQSSTASCTRSLRLCFATLLIALLSIGQMWAEDVTLPDKVLTLPTTGLGNEWGKTSASNYYYLDATNHYVIFLPYAVRMGADQTWFKVGGSGGSKEGEWTAPSGSVFKGHSYYEITDGTDNRYDALKKSTGSVHNFRVKNCTKAIALVKLGKKGTTIYANAYEVNENVVSTTASVTNSYTDSKSASQGLIELDGLDYTKEYVITVYNEGGSNGPFYEMAFYYKAVSVTYDLNGGTGTTPTETDKAPGESFVLHDGETDITAPTGQMFSKWYDGTAYYNGGATYTTGASDVTLTAQWVAAATTYDITFANGGHGTAPDTVNASKVTLGELTATGFRHLGWKANQDVTVNEETVSAGTLLANGTTAHVSAATEFTAQWIATWTVTYYDGATNLGSETVDDNAHPADYATYQLKSLAAFDGWYTDPDLTAEHKVADISTVAITADADYYGKWVKAYATSYDMEAYAISDGATKEGLLSNLTDAHYAYTNVEGIDNGHTHEYIYDGMKFKNSDGDLSFNVEAKKLVIIKTGFIVNDNALSLYINESLDGTTFESAVEGVETHKKYYFYEEDEALYRLEASLGNKETCTIKAITITDPFTVTYNAAGGEIEGEETSATFTGDALTLPSVEKGTETFLGWFTEAENGVKVGDAGDEYTPDGDITLYAHFEAVSSDKRLTALSYKVGSGAVEDIEYTDGTYTYTVTLDYANSYDAITVDATLRDSKASIKDGATMTVTTVPGDATFTVVAEDESEQTYTVHFVKGPKDGVCLVKIEPNSPTEGYLSGLYADGETLKIALSSGYNLGGSGKYIGVKATENFKEGDVLHLDMSTKKNSTSGATIILYDGNTTSSNEIWNTNLAADEEIDYYVTLPAAVEGHKELYIVRTDGNKWNGGPAVMEILRPMMPKLTALTINGREGVIDEENKTVSVLLPNDADLDNLNFDKKEIVWNAAHATTPEQILTNEGKWSLGGNTYRLMDKDGDYTDYTITLTRDVLRYTVTFMNEGEAYNTVEVEAGTAVAKPGEDPVREDYIFKGWSATTDGEVIEDWSTQTISEPTTYYAIWTPDGGIKLIDKATGAINTTNFTTDVTGTTVTIGEEEYNGAAFGGSNRESVTAVQALSELVQYNATTDKLKVVVTLYNPKGSDYSAYFARMEEGGSLVEEEIPVAAKSTEEKEYQFDGSKNRSVYLCGSKYLQILQVKVFDNGEVISKIGANGTSFTFNQGRLFATETDGGSIDGLTITSINATRYSVAATTNLVMTDGSISFYVPENVRMTVNATFSSTAEGNGYSVSSGSTEYTSTETEAVFDLTGGKTWSITPQNSNKKVTFESLSFSTPACEKPTFSALENSDVCEGEGYKKLNGTATVTDGGTITYQWYQEDGTLISGAVNAEYTPTADGKYYVVATNTLAGCLPNEAQSDLVTVTTFAKAVITKAPLDARGETGEEVTLTVEATGKDLAYQWFTCDAEGNNAVALDPAVTTPSLNVTIPDDVQYYKVVVSSSCGDPVEAVAKVEKWKELTQVDVTAATTWDWQYAANGGIKLTGETSPTKNEEALMANIKVDGVATNNDASFNSQALLFYGENVRATDKVRNYASVGYIKFNVTVPGKVTVEFSDNGSNNRKVKINDAVSPSSSSKTDVLTFSADVTAGEVTLMGVSEDETQVNQYIRISKIVFEVPSEPVEPEYVAARSELKVGRYYTVCLNKAVSAVRGASFWKIEKRDEASTVVYLEEENPTTATAGTPFIIQATAPALEVVYTGDATTIAGTNGALHGTLEDMTYTDLSGRSIYLLIQNAIRPVSTGNYLSANRAYIKYDELEVTTVAPLSVPGRRVRAIPMNGQVATGMGEVQGDNEQCTKVLINGQLYIMYNGTMYNVQGQLIK